MWKKVNKNLIVILLFVEACMMLNLCGCEKKISPESFYENNQESLEQIVSFLKENDNIEEITKDWPLLNGDFVYSKCNGIYYITTNNEKIKASDSTRLLKEIMEQLVYIFPYYYNDNFAVRFVTKSKLGEGEYLIYTENGEELQEKYIIAEKWLSDHWYIARS